jgi:membrane protease subunit (stomatin/prohibitin family)
MAIIDLVKWNGSPQLLAWKFPSTELSTWTQLVVNETQEAFLVHGGIYEGPYCGGRHTLTTENLPLLGKLMGLPFGGESPFTAEVWFVNKTIKLDMKWGTSNPMLLQDPKYQIVIPVRAHGQYGIQIGDSKKFLMKLVGTVEGFSAEALGRYFNGIFITKIRALIANYFIQKNISILEIHNHIDGLSHDVLQSIAPIVQDFGIVIPNFYVNSINIPEDDPSLTALRDALAKKAEMGIIGFDYKQERGFDVLEAIGSSNGAAGSMMGAGLGFGMGAGMAGQVSQLMNQTFQGQAPPSATGAAMPDSNAPTAKLPPGEIVKLLKDLGELRANGILSEEEFQAEKNKLLG